MASQPLLADTIEPDEPGVPLGNISSSNNAPKPREQVVLTPTNRAEAQQPNATSLANNQSDAESGIAGIFRQSSHPVSLFFLYIFRLAAVVVYVLSGYSSNYVLSTVIVVVLLAMDFWTCRNVSGRTLVGLRFWNQVDDDGESYWVFESRDPSRPANPVDSKMFWIALYAFPVIWLALLFFAIIKLNASFVPIVLLALVFNLTNAVGFTYADRDAKQKWANTFPGGSWGIGQIGGIGGQLVAGAVKNGVSRVFG